MAFRLALGRPASGRFALRVAASALLTALVAAGPAGTAQASDARSEAMPDVRPDVRSFLDAAEKRPKIEFTAEVLAAMRKSSAAQSLATMDLPVGELGEIRDMAMPGPAGPIRLRMFDPRAARGAGPVVIFYHGGGFVVGSIETHAGIAAEIARGLDLPVVSVEYRLAPEDPWPAAPDDAEAAARWIAANGQAFGREFTGLVLSGDSAGGNLTLVTALALRDRPAALPVIMQFPIYPAADRSRNYPSGRLFADGYGLDSVNMRWYERHYAADRMSWRYSALLADLQGLPPTVMVTAALDPLRDEGRAFAAKLVQSGVRTSYYEAAGMVHGFATYRRVIPSARRDVAAMIGEARALLKDLSAR